MIDAALCAGHLPLVSSVTEISQTLLLGSLPCGNIGTGKNGHKEASVNCFLWHTSLHATCSWIICTANIWAQTCTNMAELCTFLHMSSWRMQIPRSTSCTCGQGWKSGTKATLQLTGMLTSIDYLCMWENLGHLSYVERRQKWKVLACWCFTFGSSTVMKTWSCTDSYWPCWSWTAKWKRFLTLSKNMMPCLHRHIQIWMQLAGRCATYTIWFQSILKMKMICQIAVKWLRSHMLCYIFVLNPMQSAQGALGALQVKVLWMSLRPWHKIVAKG